MKGESSMKHKWILSVVSATVIVTGFSVAATRAATTSAPPASQGSTQGATITVVGSASEQVSPDSAVVSAGVLTKGSTAAQAEERNNLAMKKVMTALEKDQIPASDIQTEWYNLSPNYGKPGSDGQQSIVGFTTNNTVNITVKQLAKVGSVVDLLVKTGANQINNVNYTVSNPAKFQQSLYSLALDNARSQAQSIANKLGVTITGVSSVDASQQGGGVLPMFAAASNAMGATTAVLSPGTQSISTNLTVVYTIN